jgi:hypothetical protein
MPLHCFYTRKNIISKEDVLYAGLCYAGFAAKRQTCKEPLKLERFQSFYKACPEAVLDIKKYLDEYQSDHAQSSIDFQQLLHSLNFLKLCKYSSSMDMD